MMLLYYLRAPRLGTFQLNYHQILHPLHKEGSSQDSWSSEQNIAQITMLTLNHNHVPPWACFKARGLERTDEGAKNPPFLFNLR